MSLRSALVFSSIRTKLLKKKEKKRSQTGLTYITLHAQLHTTMYVSYSTSVAIFTGYVRLSACFATLTSINPLDPYHRSPLVMYTGYSLLYSTCNYNQYPFKTLQNLLLTQCCQVPQHLTKKRIINKKNHDTLSSSVVMASLC